MILNQLNHLKILKKNLISNILYLIIVNLKNALLMNDTKIKIFLKKYNFNTFVVAEISANHVKIQLLKVVNNASSIGVDAIKLQLYKAKLIDIDLPEFKINKKIPGQITRHFMNYLKRRNFMSGFQK